MLWHAWMLAKTFRCRPSEIYDITGSYRAYMFDSAVANFGMALENALDSVDDKNKKSAAGKRERILNRWLGREQRYRNPTGPTASRSKTPESRALRAGGR